MAAKMILFDVGNTLIEFNVERACRLVGIDCPDSSKANLMRSRMARNINSNSRRPERSQRSIFALIAESLGDQSAMVPTRAAILADADRKTSLWDLPNSDAAQVIKDLDHVGLKRGILSNSDGRVKTLLDELGFLGFDPILDSAVVGFSKPDPRIFHIACHLGKFQPEEVVHVGDQPWVDGLGALEAGLDSIICDPMNLFEADCIEVGARFGREITRVSSILEIMERVAP